MRNLIVRKLRAEDWRLYKEVRLRSLVDSPTAFSSTYEKECEFGDEQWIERICGNDRVTQSILLIAELSDEAVGLAAGVVHDEGDDTGKVYQMWVDPKFRRTGVGKMLLKNIIDWAQDIGLSSLRLEVTESHIEAVNLYASFGFHPTGDTYPLRKGSDLQVQDMALGIEAHAA